MNIRIKYLTILLYFINISVYLSYADDDPTLVTLPYGTIRGHVLETSNGNPYYAFQQIPYADPPVGELRFKEPTPPKSWTGILETTKNTYVCYQLDPPSVTANVTETEACLYLNVYTPVKPGDSANIPVLVWFHGGGYVSGDGTFQIYGPQFLIDYNIIVVTINYRLGPLGFLTTEDGVIPGNLGMKDQNFALQWVKSNIKLFGGDPEKVTISGESAGATAVGLHVVSKKSKGLFRGAILESGTATCAYTNQLFARYFAFELGRALDPNFTSEDSKDLLKLLMSAKASDITNAKFPVPLDKQLQASLWIPVIESESLEGTFQTGLMQEEIKNGNINRVPILLGFNSEERIVDLTSNEGLEGFQSYAKYIDEHLNKIVDNVFPMSEENKYVAGEKLRKIYTDGQFQDDIPAFIRYSSDSTFSTPIVRHAELQSKYTDVYLYQLSYKGLMGRLTTIVGDLDIDGVGHTEDVRYIWNDAGDDGNTDITQYPVEDILTHYRILKLWTNFVKYSNPTPEEDALLGNVIWTKVAPNNLTYLDINHKLEVKTGPKKYNEWKDIVDAYAIPPLPVY